MICYATMRDENGQLFTYKLAREGYSLFLFVKDFQQVAKKRGWTYIECGTTEL